MTMRVILCPPERAASGVPSRPWAKIAIVCAAAFPGRNPDLILPLTYLGKGG